MFQRMYLCMEWRTWAWVCPSVNQVILLHVSRHVYTLTHATCMPRSAPECMHVHMYRCVTWIINIHVHVCTCNDCIMCTCTVCALSRWCSVCIPCRVCVCVHSLLLDSFLIPSIHPFIIMDCISLRYYM